MPHEPKIPQRRAGWLRPHPDTPRTPESRTHPRNPEDEPGIDELPENEGVRPLDEDDSTAMDPERVREETDNAVRDGEIDPR